MNRRRTRRLALGLCPLALCLLAGCQQRMANQPHYRSYEETPFFPNGQMDRPLPPGTVARGHLRTDRHLFTGLRPPEATWARPLALLGGGSSPLGALALSATSEEEPVDSFPFPITYEVLTHGHDRYMIYCVVCHDPLGTGRGMIVQRGYTPPPSYHIERLRQVPVGHFYDVITRGYGSMPDYREQVPPRDRWAIAAYIRALQYSQHFPVAELTAEMRQGLDNQGGAAAPGGQRP